MHEKIGAQGRVSFGSAEQLEEVWGVRPGAVTPFGAINDHEGRVTVVLDAAMMRHARLNFHPLVNTRTTGLASADLVMFLRATGHEPMVVALGQDEPPLNNPRAPPFKRKAGIAPASPVRRAGDEEHGNVSGSGAPTRGQSEGRHDRVLQGGRVGGVDAPAGAGRFLGALVRSLQAARAGAGEGGRRLKGKVTLVKMNIDDHPQIAGQLGIQSIPGRHRVRQGPAGRRLRRRAAGKPDARLHRAAGRPARRRFDAMLSRGGRSWPPRRHGGAAALYTEILGEDPTHPKAIGGLAKLHVDAGRLDQAKALL